MAFLRQACASRAASSNFTVYSSGSSVAGGSVAAAGSCAGSVTRLGRSYHVGSGAVGFWSSAGVQARVLAKERRQHIFEEPAGQRSKSTLTAAASPEAEEGDSQLLQPASCHNRNNHRHFHRQQSQQQRLHAEQNQHAPQQHWSQQRLWSLSPWTAAQAHSSQLLLKPAHATLLHPPTSYGYSTTTPVQTVDNVGGDRLTERYRPPKPKIPAHPKRDPLDVSFNNPVAAFKSKTTLELVRAYVVYMICSSEKLVEHNMTVSELCGGDRILCCCWGWPICQRVTQRGSGVTFMFFFSLIALKLEGRVVGWVRREGRDL